MDSEFDSILNHFSQYIKVSDAFKKELLERISYKTFEKGDLLQDADKICTESHFILNGLTRTYYLKDGMEISEYFSCENEWINSPKSFIERTKDIYYIDCLEKTHTFCLKINDLGYLFDHFPEMERYARLSMGSVFGHLMERITSQRFTTAKEKYEHFLTTYKGVYHRIPLGMVASYLGITQSTLSRLRAGK
ncbi:Crp/Fnr family transcriptional regulator [Chryseobacterium paridis]|uniref:Crp/Fnr family transcriptional regulator n=1 Tax=Chryseobacterium paridis TaxID=2800328 RepID=A0ABS1FUB2_9FLAO|nr:Crp/Fnr family transcriptional regulator [Chryseobacterium paridis]MBK1895994.1 Crp/Fnr family transcriptional regulator [Chryseobacterium paridis]